MTTLRWFTLALLAANALLVIGNSVLMTRNAAIYRHALAVTEALPDHACGAVIEAHETCSMTFAIPLPLGPGAPPARPLRFHAP